nr:MFS transporter [Anoxybacter fermentans]
MYKIVREKVLKGILSKTEKNKYISLLLVTENFLNVTLPSLAALILQKINPYIFIFINAVSFFISALLTIRVEYNHSLITQKKYIDLETKNIRKALQMFPDMSIIYVSAMVLTFVSVTLNLVIMQYIDEKQIVNGVYYIGVFKTLFAIGAVIGSGLISYLKEDKIKSLKKFIILSNIIFLPYMIIDNIWIFASSILLYGLIFNVLNGLVQLYYQIEISNDFLGYLRSIHTILVGIIVPISMFINNSILKRFSLKIEYGFLCSLCIMLYFNIKIIQDKINKRKEKIYV